MSVLNSNSYENQAQRRKNKTVDQQMKQIVVEGTGISPWEADVLLKVIDDVYFGDQNAINKPGCVLFNCVSSQEGAGKALSECKMTTVKLSVYQDSDRENLKKTGQKHRAPIIRQRRLLRITEEAIDQGGLLSQEDLANILMCDTKTIRRDIKDFAKIGITVKTRGQMKDIGPGITHRELIVRHWMEGKEEQSICKATKHSMKSVENYLSAFKRVVYLRTEKSFTDHEISVTAGVSKRAVKTYLDIYDELKNKGMHKQRMSEILVKGDQYYKETGEKKSSLSSSKLNEKWRVK